MKDAPKETPGIMMGLVGVRLYRTRYPLKILNFKSYLYFPLLGS